MLWLVGFSVICIISGAVLFAIGARDNPPWAIGGPVAAIVLMSVLLVLIHPDHLATKLPSSPGSVDEDFFTDSRSRTQPNRSLTDAVLHPADVPPWGQPGTALDLLAGLDPQKTQIFGRWTMQNGSLISPIGTPATMYLPVRLPRKYELTAVVERIQGTNSLNFGLTIGGRSVTALIDGYQGNVSGLNRIDNATAERNESRRLGPFIHAGRPTTIICKVGENSIHVTCDNRVAIDWQGDVNRLERDPHMPHGPAGHLHISCWESRFRISKLELRSLP